MERESGEALSSSHRIAACLYTRLLHKYCTVRYTAEMRVNLACAPTSDSTQLKTKLLLHRLTAFDSQHWSFKKFAAYTVVH